MINNVEEALAKCTVDGLLVRPPVDQVDTKTYAELKKRLQLIGGTWKSGKVFAFVFQEDPAALLAELQDGKERNLKKEFQFFATPPDVARLVVQEADIKPGMSVLEPSAGQGALIDAVLENLRDQVGIDYYELMPVNKQILLKKYPPAVNGELRYAVSFQGDDFLQARVLRLYDRIIANPPFTRNADIDHVMRMWDFLEPGGRLVAITSRHWISSTNRKESKFREWVYEVHDGTVNGIGVGAFEESGTKIDTVMITLDKPNM